jgi:hypothetical protein
MTHGTGHGNKTGQYRKGETLREFVVGFVVSVDLTEHLPCPKTPSGAKQWKA